MYKYSTKINYFNYKIKYFWKDIKEIYEKRDVSMTLLFDHDANLQERIFKEQFLT